MPTNLTGSTIASTFDQLLHVDDGTAATEKTVYATTGTINTSDEHAKQDIAALSDAEKQVAIALKGLIKKFRFKDAV